MIIKGGLGDGGMARVPGETAAEVASPSAGGRGGGPEYRCRYEKKVL